MASGLKSKILLAMLVMFVAIATWSFLPVRSVRADIPNCPWCSWGGQEYQFSYNGCQNWNLGCWLANHDNPYTYWCCQHWHKYCYYNGQRCSNYGVQEGNTCNECGCCYR